MRLPRRSASLSRLALWASVAVLLVVAANARALDEKCEVGSPAPPFTIRRLNPSGTKPEFFALKRHVGEDPDDPKAFVVLSFAASYCEPCRRELPELAKLAPKLAAANIAVAVVVMDRDPAEIEAMRKLTVDELQLPFAVLTDHTGLVATRYRANPLPYLVVIDAKGIVRAVRSGFTPTSMAELTAVLGLPADGGERGARAKTLPGSSPTRAVSPAAPR